MEATIDLESSKAQDAMTLSFIQDARKVHGVLYNYEKTDYVRGQYNVIIICKEHGEFSQSPYSHLRGSGCQKCGRNVVKKKLTKTLNQFLIDAKRVHNEEYDYTKTVYVGKSDKVIITCRFHGDFMQEPSNHLQGQGCPVCGIDTTRFVRTKSTKDFIVEAQLIHNNAYIYTRTKYINARQDIVITCPSHGDFQQLPTNHLKGSGCPKCAAVVRAGYLTKSLEQFIIDANVVHENKYSYTRSNYVNDHTKIVIACGAHGEFEQTPTNHLSGNGCPKCMNKTETILMEFLAINDIVYFDQFAPKWLVNNETNCKRRFDIVIHLFKTIIEIDGGQHFRQVMNWSPPEVQRQNDVNKMFLALEHGYTVIRLIQEDIYNNTWNWQQFILDSIAIQRNDPEIIYQDTPLYQSHESLFWEIASQRYTL
jgi:hypothetical protein